MKQIQMPKWLVALLLSTTLSCNTKKTDMSPIRQKAILDSIVQVRSKELRIEESLQLRDRLSIELKEKVDSILASRKVNTIVSNPPIATDTIPAVIDTIHTKDSL